MSTASQRLEWKAAGLPADDLCSENAIILSRFNRYPLVIDPSGQASEFVLKHLSSVHKKVQLISLLDPAFFKALESALRFGTALIVHDVEGSVDPILNPVLNREFNKVLVSSCWL